MLVATPLMPSVSVVISTHNGAARLAATLAHIAAQTETNHVSWEVIVVDNASRDNSGDVAAEAWRQTGGSASFRVIHEPRPGAQFARMAGVRAAVYDIVCFVDDDNWLPPDWVGTASHVMANQPDVGACGGSSKPVFEGQEPAWFAMMADAFAVGDQYTSRRILASDEWSLWGAGLCVRRALILKALDLGWQPLLPCRSGTQLTSGGDAEICMLVRMTGSQLLYEPALTLQHFIAESKCKWDYVTKLMRGFGVSSVILFQYAKVLGLVPHDTALSRLRMRCVSIWIFEVVRAVFSYVAACVQAALSRDPRSLSERMRHLKRGRLAGLMEAFDTYSMNMKSIHTLHARLNPHSRF